VLNLQHNLTGEQAIRLCEVLAEKLGDARPLPDGAARVAVAFSRLGQYQVENPGVRVRKPAEWKAGADAGERNAGPASNQDSTVGQRSNSGERGGNAPPRGAEQQASQQQDAAVAAPTSVELLCVDAFEEALVDDDLRAFVRGSRDVRQAINELFASAQGDADTGQWSDAEVIEHWVAEASALVRRTFAESQRLARLATLDQEDQSLFPDEWLAQGLTWAKQARLGDFDISKSPIELTAAQQRIANDKKLVEACATFNMASMLTHQRDRERDKELRRRAEVANKAAFCFGLLRQAYSTLRRTRPCDLEEGSAFLRLGP